MNKWVTRWDKQHDPGKCGSGGWLAVRGRGRASWEHSLHYNSGTHPHVSVHSFRHVVKCMWRILVVHLEKGSVLDIPGIKHIHHYGRGKQPDPGHFLSLSLSIRQKTETDTPAVVYHEPDKKSFHHEMGKDKQGREEEKWLWLLFPRLVPRERVILAVLTSTHKYQVTRTCFQASECGKLTLLKAGKCQYLQYLQRALVNI